MDIRQILHRLNLSRRYAIATFKSLTDNSAFENLETFCLFVGNPRSGHTLVGSLIDAHPAALIADEMDVLKYLAITPGRELLFWMIQQNAAEAAQAGRERAGYYYKVPNQWQGKFQTLRVIGDKKGGRIAWIFAAQPEQYERLKKFVRLPIKFIHVIRNPYDNITTMARRRELSDLAPMIKGYFQNCDGVLAVKQLAGEAAVLDIRQETLIREPDETIRTMCRFLDLEPEESYVRDCASILFQTPKHTPAAVQWSPQAIEDVARRVEQYPFLNGYNFES